MEREELKSFKQCLSTGVRRRKSVPPNLTIVCQKSMQNQIFFHHFGLFFNTCRQTCFQNECAARSKRLRATILNAFIFKARLNWRVLYLNHLNSYIPEHSKVWRRRLSVPNIFRRSREPEKKEKKIVQYWTLKMNLVKTIFMLRDLVSISPTFKERICANFLAPKKFNLKCKYKNALCVTFEQKRPRVKCWWIWQLTFSLFLRCSSKSA
jgi:hypothetical protein